MFVQFVQLGLFSPVRLFGLFWGYSRLLRRGGLDLWPLDFKAESQVTAVMMNLCTKLEFLYDIPFLSYMPGWDKRVLTAEFGVFLTTDLRRLCHLVAAIAGRLEIPVITAGGLLRWQNEDRRRGWSVLLTRAEFQWTNCCARIRHGQVTTTSERHSPLSRCRLLCTIEFY